MNHYNGYQSGYGLLTPPPHGPEGKGDDQGDHETPTPGPSETPDAPSSTVSPSPSPSAPPAPSPGPSGEPSTSAAPSTQAPSTYETEPAEDTPDGAGTLPQTSGLDPWLAFTFVLVAVLAIAGGALMRRHARRLGTR